MRCPECGAATFQTMLVNNAGRPVDRIVLDAQPDPNGPYALRLFLRRGRRLAVRRLEWPERDEGTRSYSWSAHRCFTSR